MRSQANHSSQATVMCNEKRTESPIRPCIVSWLLALLQVLCCHKVGGQSLAPVTSKDVTQMAEKGFNARGERVILWGRKVLATISFCTFKQTVVRVPELS